MFIKINSAAEKGKVRELNVKPVVIRRYQWEKLIKLSFSRL